MHINVAKINAYMLILDHAIANKEVQIMHFVH